MSEPQTGARRYPRTFGGLIGSMIVLVIVLVALWVVMAPGRGTHETQPDAVDYLETVSAAQQGGYTLAYPSSLPEGWEATSVRFTPGDRPVWGLPMLTDEGKYVGIEQEDAPLSDLLDTYVDANAEQGDDVTIDSQVATTWTSWSDSGGDHAFAAEVGDDTLLVYGSAPVEELKRLVGLLTTAPTS